MGKCAVCPKKYERGKGTYFRVPIGEQERLLWSKSCQTQLGEKDFVCSDHFSRKDMICGSRKAKLLTKAVPSPLCAVSNTRTAAVQHKVNKVQHKFVKKSSNRQFGTNMSVLISPTKPSQCLDLNPAKLTFSLAEKTAVQVKDVETQMEVRIIEFLNDLEVSNLKKEIKSLKALNKELNKQLNQAYAVLSHMKKIFTEGQIRKIISPDKNIKWFDADIENAISLHEAGPKAYNYLYEKGFPLPHESTLRRWHRKCDISKGVLAESIDCVQHTSELLDDDPLMLL